MRAKTVWSTGYGKSLCYHQLLPFLLYDYIYKRGKMNAAEAEWIVVSDQVSSLQSRGVSADS